MTASVDISTLSREVKELHDTNPAWTLDNVFIHWFLQAFLLPDATLAARYVTGVSHDKGVDGIYIDDSVAKVFILQGKFHQGPKPPNEKRPDVTSFADLSKTLLGPKKNFEIYLKGIDPSVGKRLTDSKQRLNKRKYELHLFYVTTGKCSSALKSEAESIVGQANGRATISILDRQDILSLLVDYLGGAAPPVPFLDLKFDTRGIAGSDGVLQRYEAATGIDSIILAMSGAEVASMYRRAGDRLFARNIRGFLGDTSINEGMRITLKRQPEHFWYFNNGVTIVCDSARKTSEHGQAILRVTNPQVINGQQTTRVLSTIKGNKKASVLVRVISVPRGRNIKQEQFEQLVSNIVAATNWQNAILQSDLRANDSRQVNLQRNLAKLGYHYLRKRQSKKEARKILGGISGFWVKKDELAQVVGACEFDPYVVRSGKEGLFKNPHYDGIFDKRPLHEYLTIYWLGRIIKYKGAGVPDRAYAKWHALHFLWKEVGQVFRKRSVADYFRRACERRQWPREIEYATDQIYRGLLEFYRAKRGDGVHAVDVSNFFYRPHQHDRFEAYWRTNLSQRRKRVREKLKRFTQEVKTWSEG